MSKTAVSKGSGNVFEDLGYQDAAEHQTKARLVGKIAGVIERRGMTHSEAAVKLGIDQPKVSAMLSGRFRGLSVFRLMRLASRMGLEVNIVTRNPRSRPVEVEEIPVAAD